MKTKASKHFGHLSIGAKPAKVLEAMLQVSIASDQLVVFFAGEVILFQRLMNR